MFTFSGADSQSAKPHRMQSCATIVITIACLLGLLVGPASLPALAQATGPPPQDTKWREGLATFDAELRNLRNQDRIAEIRALCQERCASATDPEHRAYYLRSVGNTYEWQEDWDQAIPIFKQVIEEFPASNGQVPWAMHDLAQAYIAKSRLGNLAENLALAMLVLEQYVEQYPNHIRFVGGLHLLGQCYERLGDDETALAYYLEGVERYPSWPYARTCVVYAATLQAKLAQWDDVIALARTHLDFRPLKQPAGAHLAAALAYVSQGDMTAALEEFDRAAAEHSINLDESFTNRDAYYTFFYRLTDCPQVSALLTQALAMQPEGETAAFIKLAMGRVAVRAGNKDDAGQWFQRVVSEHPDSKLAAEARLWAGWCLMADNPADAIPHFEKVVTKDAAHERIVSALGYLAMCYSAVGDFEQAQAAYIDLATREDAAKAAAGLLAEANALARDHRFDDCTAKCLEVITLAPGSEYAQAAQALIANPWLGQLGSPEMVIARTELEPAVALSKEKRYDESIAKCQEVIAEEPEGLAAAEAALLIGHNLMWPGRIAEALEQYDHVRTAYKDTTAAMQAQYYFAMCKAVLREDRDAIREYEVVLAQDFDPKRLAITHGRLAELHRGLGYYDQAKAEIDAMLADDRPEFVEMRPSAHIELAWLYETMKEYDKARAEYELVVRDYPDTLLADHAREMLAQEWRYRPPGP